MSRIILALSLALVFFGTLPVADATVVDFELGDADNSLGYDTTELSINYEISSGLSGTTFALEEKESFQFDFATITSIMALVDKDTYSITAYLSFILPEEMVVQNDATVKTIEVSGQCGMSSEEFWMYFDPVDVAFGTDGLFTLQLGDVYAYPSTGSDTTCGYGYSCYFPGDEDTIIATVTLQKSPTAVPEPSTFILFGTILAGALGVKGIRKG
ncbi:MAG: PEP-CTERM sorting domain-containing protein [DPANN group archaeon]|nr:PEP-CTERM sorting domain-containing protein [DPANN group archaeon]